MGSLVEHRAGSGMGDPGGSGTPAEPDSRDETHRAQPVEGAVEPATGELGTGEPTVRAAAAVVVEPEPEPEPSPGQLRVDFGAHLEANYQRLVAQLYAITLDAGDAHEAVQQAYSRAWPHWSTISRSPDPTAWVRRVAVRSTVRTWRSLLALVGLGRSHGSTGAAAEPRTAALLDALQRLPVAERRAMVLFHMVGMPMAEIAALERVPLGSVQARLSRGRGVVSEGMAEVLAEVLGPYRGRATGE